MSAVFSWLKIKCPECLSEMKLPKEISECRVCGKNVSVRDGIIYLLPSNIENQKLKDAEKEGWSHLCSGTIDNLRDLYLGIPFSYEDVPEFTHYREAAREFRVALSYLGDLTGKHGIDLGGSIGWAAYQFARLGAQMVLADYNDGTPSGLGGAQIYLEQGIQFDRICMDAEKMPLADEQFDFVFCCAFLHHLPNPGSVINSVARVLRKGGIFIATCEGFCPSWMSRKMALDRCQTALDFMHEGVNEQVFYMSEYRRWFKKAGLKFNVINPRWDSVTPGEIVFNKKLADPGYVPEILANRANRTNLSGLIARIILRSSMWRMLLSPSIFRFLRPALLANTQKFRILIGLKQ